VRTFLDSLAADLASLERAGLRRHLRLVRGGRGPEVEIEGRRVLNLSSNNYLGLASDPLLDDIAASHDGYGSSASRLIAGTASAHVALEADLADWLGVEAALLFNSGYQANVGAISALLGPEDAVFSDELNHASLIDGCRLSRARVFVYRHGDPGSLAEHLRVCPPVRRRLVVTESLFSMDGDVPDLAVLTQTAHDHGAAILVDEAHAIGALGPEGRGLAATLPIDFRIGTFGKALGTFGAFFAGPRVAVDWVLNRARSFVFTTALPMPLVERTRRSLAIVRGPEGDRRRNALAEAIAMFHVELSRAGFALPSHSPILPLRVRGGEPAAVVALSNDLLAEGVFAQGIRPPTVPPGTARIRLSLMATHTADQLERAAAILARHRSRFA
jgi:8-amino-7-oxononanoate synthase